MSSTSPLNAVKLTQIARATYDLVVCEDDPARLLQLQKLVLALAPLLNEAESELHPDLGLEFIEYVQLKREGTYPGQVKRFGEDVDDILRNIEMRLSRLRH